MIRKVLIGALGALVAAWLTAFAVPAHPTPTITVPAPADVLDSRNGVIFESHDSDGANTMLPADQAIESAIGQVNPRRQPDSANSDRQFN
ncbi:hypothetical protein [Micromonospora sp. NPDC051141]|uniref:hypothetical protein n=1 Tax=Micromonospora sp. NPDC051141 TaxID=3364284 RepID=UPI00379CA2D3